MDNKKLIGTSRTRSLGANVRKNDNDELEFVLISEENSGMRYSWSSGKYYEELLDPNGANTDRLNTMFKDHNRSVDSAIGVFTSTKIEGGELVGTVKFGTGEDEQNVKRKYEEGILTDVSIGYIINAHTVEERDGQPDLVTITDYDVFECSAVGVGFDAGAKKRFEDEVPSELIERLNNIEKKLMKG